MSCQERGDGEHPFLGLVLGEDQCTCLCDLPQFDLLPPLQMMDQLAFDILDAGQGLVPGALHRPSESGIYLSRGRSQAIVPRLESGSDQRQSTYRLIGQLLPYESGLQRAGWLEQILQIDTEFLQHTIDTRLDQNSRPAWQSQLSRDPHPLVHGRRKCEVLKFPRSGEVGDGG